MPEQRFRQPVPRPAEFFIAEDPPWTAPGLDPSRHITLSEIETAVASLPSHITPDDEVRSAVLVPVFERDNRVHVVLIRRSASLNHDPDHIAFPGGRIDQGETAREAAVREAEEEIGLDPADIRIVLPLPVARRRRNHEVVAPFVGVLSKVPSLVASPDEVDAVFEIALETLLQRGSAWTEDWGVEEDGRRRYARFFSSDEVLEDNLVWGLTAGILWQLLVALTDGSSNQLLNPGLG